MENLCGFGDGPCDQRPADRCEDAADLVRAYFAEYSSGALSALAIGFNNAVLAEAGMSYLGIGVQPPDASLGRMPRRRRRICPARPWCAVFPGVFLAIASYWARDCSARDPGSVRRWKIMLQVERLSIHFADREEVQEVVRGILIFRAGW